LHATPPETAGKSEQLSPNESNPKPLPTILEIAKFSGPALALWISSPLLSVIDSSAVGLSGGASSAIALAAMGPGTTVMDGSTYLFAFLNVATTNLLATAAANSDRDEMQLVLATAKRYALRCGFGVAALLLFAAPAMLNLYVGSSAAAEIVGPASNYVRIRALAMPIALLSNALQAALLGSKDSMTPLIALGLAAVLNCFGDLLLVVGARLGLAGAAIATVASQVAGLLLLMKASGKTLPMAESKAATPEARKAASKRFLAFCPPVLLVVIGKMATFGFMTHVASCLPPEIMAAHQIALSTFFLLGETSPYSHIVPSLSSIHFRTNSRSADNVNRSLISNIHVFGCFSYVFGNILANLSSFFAPIRERHLERSEERCQAAHQEAAGLRRCGWTSRCHCGRGPRYLWVWSLYSGPRGCRCLETPRFAALSRGSVAQFNLLRRRSAPGPKRARLPRESVLLFGGIYADRVVGIEATGSWAARCVGCLRGLSGSSRGDLELPRSFEDTADSYAAI